MTLSRFTRTSLLLLFMLVVAAGIYLYRNLDAILQQQVRQNLQEFGAQNYDLQKPRLGAGVFSAAGLSLSGHFENLDYSITLHDLVIHYDWRILLTRQARSVRVSGLDIRTSGAIMAPTVEAKTEPTNIDSSSLMPLELLAQLPARTIEIDRLQFEHVGPDTPDIAGHGHLHYGDGLDIGMRVPLAGIELSVRASAETRDSPLLLSLALTEDSAQVAAINATLTTVGWDDRDWHVTGEWQHDPLLRWLRRLAESDGGPAPGVTLQGKGELAARIRHPSVLQVGPGLLWEQVLPLEIEADLSGEIEQLDVPGITKAQLPGLALTLALNDGKLQVDAAPLQLSGELEHALLPLSGDARRWLRWEDRIPARLQITEPLRISFDGKTASLQAPASSLQLGTEQSQLSLQRVELQATLTSGANPAADTRLQARLDTRLRQQALPALDLALRQQGPVVESEVELGLDATEGQLDAALTGTLDLLQGRGELDLSVQSEDLGELPGSLLPALAKLDVLDADLQLEAGSFGLETQLRTAEGQWTQTSYIELANATGQYDEYRFNNLDFGTALTGLDTVQTVKPITLSLERLDVGFAVTDIIARASIPRATPADRPALALEEFSAKLFGGEVFLPEAGTWDFGAESNSLVLGAQQWQLAQIVALQQSEDIQAQGLLEGKLPVTLADGRVTIDKGYLRALPPGGTIRYLVNDASSALGKNSKELAMALALLSDFRYDVLSSDVELDSGGNLLLGLSLAGHNPGQYDGQAVQFNINLEQNLDPLLQSLRLSGKLTEEIENRVQ